MLETAATLYGGNPLILRGLGDTLRARSQVEQALNATCRFAIHSETILRPRVTATFATVWEMSAPAAAPKPQAVPHLP